MKDMQGLVGSTWWQGLVAHDAQGLVGSQWWQGLVAAPAGLADAVTV